MRLALITAAGGLLSIGAAAPAPSYVDDCSASLAARWPDAAAAHPIDHSKHIPVVLINVPRAGPQNRYQNAIRDLTQAFPSFRESAGSGILTGCCAFPVSGAISFDELAKLSAAKFVPLCDVGRRSDSTSVQVRMEYREPYERHVGAAPYFWISS